MRTTNLAACSRVRAGRAANNTPDTGVATGRTSRAPLHPTV
ncbi:MAG: hypothetical protein WCS31_14525 [Verrucomicrobiae bacterium]